MSNYLILLGPIADGAVLRKQGSLIELAEADAAPLLKLGAIEPAPESEKEQARKPRASRAAD